MAARDRGNYGAAIKTKPEVISGFFIRFELDPLNFRSCGHNPIWVDVLVREEIMQLHVINIDGAANAIIGNQIQQVTIQVMVRL